MLRISRAIPLLALLLTGCASSSAPPTPVPAHVDGSAAVVTQDIAWLSRHSYTVDHHLTVGLRDGPILYVFHSTCTGSADGHCQDVDAFRGAAHRPFWRHQYADVRSMHAVANGFSLTIANYGPGDPLCCPSLPPVTDTYTWSGRGLVESGQLPRTPGA